MMEWCEGCDNRDLVINRIIKENDDLRAEIEELKKNSDTNFFRKVTTK